MPASYIYVADLEGKNVRILETTNNTVIKTLNFTHLLPTALALTADARYIYVSGFIYPSSGSDPEVIVIDTASQSIVATITLDEELYDSWGIAVSPDGSRVYVGNYDTAPKNKVSVIDTATNTVLTTITVGDAPIGVGVTPDGCKLYVCNELGYQDGTNEGTVSVIDTSTNSVIKTINMPTKPGSGTMRYSDPHCVTFSFDGRYAYITLAYTQVVAIIDTQTDTVIDSIGGFPTDSWTQELALTPDGRKLYVADDSAESVVVIDVETRSVIATVVVDPIGNGYCPYGIVVTPDGSRVYSANYASTPATMSVINTTTDTLEDTFDLGGTGLREVVAVPAGVLSGPASPSNSTQPGGGNSAGPNKCR